jgi:bacterioferritin-associated ferredoxin
MRIILNCEASPRAMYICVCHAITDREIRGAMDLGATSLADLKALLGVGTGCGRCEDCAKHLVNEMRREHCQASCGDD